MAIATLEYVDDVVYSNINNSKCLVINLTEANVAYLDCQYVILSSVKHNSSVFLL